MTLIETDHDKNLLIIIIVPLTLFPLYLLFLVWESTQRKLPSGSLHNEFVCFLFLQAHRETDRFLPTSGVQ